MWCVKRVKKKRGTKTICNKICHHRGFQEHVQSQSYVFFISNKYSDQNTKQDEQINMLSPHINRGHNSPAGGEKEFLG